MAFGPPGKCLLQRENNKSGSAAKHFHDSLRTKNAFALLGAGLAHFPSDGLCIIPRVGRCGVATVINTAAGSSPDTIDLDKDSFGTPVGDLILLIGAGGHEAARRGSEKRNASCCSFTRFE
jgi:hypothetical protein